MTYKKMLNQSGASAIMFAMVFIVVISLISLGFATLARRDQRAALDKNISQEAQLAAESGVNSVKEYVKSTINPLSKVNCTDADPPSYINPKFSTNGGPEISCITWNLTPDFVEKAVGPYETWSFEDSSAGNTSIITFSSSSGTVYTTNNPIVQLPNLQAGKLPIIKVAEVSKADLLNTDQPKVEIFYLVPSSTGVSSVNLSDGINNTNGNARAFAVLCNGTVCTANVSGYPSSSAGANRLFFFQVIGDKEAIITYDSNSVGGKVVGVQAEVDVNVKINDQTKRIKSRIPYGSQTWQPWFAALADNLCKDIKVDGTNTNGKIPNDSVAACPNN
jgi:Tfp pilus assembly protein PilX